MPEGLEICGAGALISLSCINFTSVLKGDAVAEWFKSLLQRNMMGDKFVDFLEGQNLVPIIENDVKNHKSKKLGRFFVSLSSSYDDSLSS